ncbi:ABC-F family ATP-binding cassette domain-containing protein [Salinicoccus sp. ID82-1]|uniref:ribosomal protection-like ABC-F family protein n=1 Tax=Salinicoccus sp. ID82-1 TaxID=2820269 RepID=UPI001F0113E9|nr:ATP-binding cassette domain-containing protein [Salinicoccus sp. ID82-1]MCG1010779.1 ABC-F family ATP-binding cassette domain-containing protein [Salinicoccus sp. ID82-1]
MLEINSLTLEVEGEQLLHVDQVRVVKPTIIGLIGDNGTGKTTLLRHIVETHDNVTYIPQIKETEGMKSGGETTKQYLLDGLKEYSQILLLDEPTTHLDENNIRWLTGKLKRYDGIVVVISHDRHFLDQVAREIWSIEQKALCKYPGNYTKFKQVQEEKLRRQQEEYRQYVNEKKAIEDKIRRKNDQAARSNVAEGVDHGDSGSSPYFNRLQKKLHSTSKAMASRLDHLEEKEKPVEKKEIIFHSDTENKYGNKMIIRFDAGVSIDDKLLIQNPGLYVRNGEKIAISGPNGSGKTTLINRIVTKYDGQLNIGYFHQNLEGLDADRTILENVMDTATYDETTVRIMLGRLNIRRDDVHKPVKLISGGERIKVQLVKILVMDADILILDEPTNYLDIHSVEALESMIVNYPNTVLTISHDRRFKENISDKEYVIKDRTLKENVTVRTKDETEEALMVVENKISQVLGDMADGSTEALDMKFQELIAEKKRLVSERK